MGQAEVLKFLKEERRRGRRWWGVGEVREAMRLKGAGNGSLRGVGNDLMRLAAFGLVQWRGVGWWNHKKEFRGKR